MYPFINSSHIPLSHPSQQTTWDDLWWREVLAETWGDNGGAPSPSQPTENSGRGLQREDPVGKAFGTILEEDQFECENTSRVGVHKKCFKILTISMTPNITHPWTEHSKRWCQLWR